MDSTKIAEEIGNLLGALTALIAKAFIVAYIFKIVLGA